MSWTRSWRRVSTSTSPRFPSSALCVRRWRSSDWRVCRTRRRLRFPCWCGRSFRASGRAPWRSSRTAAPDASSRRRARSWSSKATTSVLARPAANDVEPVESLFAYPMGRWKGGAQTTPLSRDEAANVRKWLRIALAAEASGLLAGRGRIGGRSSHPAQAVRAAARHVPGAASSHGRVRRPRGRRAMARTESRGYGGSRRCGARGAACSGKRHAHHLRRSSDARRDGDDARASAASLDLSPEGAALRARRARRSGARRRRGMLRRRADTLSAVP